MMLGTSYRYIIAGYFNGYLMTMLENKLLDVFTGHVQMV